MMIKSLLGSLALLNCAAARSDLPVLDLPWGKWQATVFPEDPKIYQFKNVRFGILPERFGAPSFPPKDETASFQNITGATTCIQVDIKAITDPAGGKHPLGDPEDLDPEETEDCLFLDVYAPVSAFEPDAKPLPIVVWIYGGAYAFGSKDSGGPLYTGQSMLAASDYQAIFITGNYRVGAFGWLAGKYVEDNAQPNAGLYDQALLFEWVKQYASQVRGDTDRISAWGLSAGAGSILHHLIREDGAVEPPFQTFNAHSPGFQWAWDNSPGGKLDEIYKDFSKRAGCGSEYNITCLREASPETLKTANQELFNDVMSRGLFPVGPSVDGKWIKSIPALTFNNSLAQLSHHISSSLISHTGNEAGVFTPDIETEEDLDRYLEDFIPGSHLGDLRSGIKKHYDCRDKSWLHPLAGWKVCTRHIIRDASFTCNARNLFDAFQENSHMLKYSFPALKEAAHGSDLIALFANSKKQVHDMLITMGVTEYNATIYSETLEFNIRKKYQNYYASFAATGEPNAFPLEGQLKWPVAVGGGDTVKNVLEVAEGYFHLIDNDGQTTETNCNYWKYVASEIETRRADVAKKGRLQSQEPEEL